MLGISEATCNTTGFSNTAVCLSLSGSQLKNVSTISCNNDAELGAIIAEAYEKVGKDGTVLMEESETNDTFVEIVDGVQLKSHLTSPHWVTDKERQTAVISCFL